MSREPPGWDDDAVDNPNKGDANARGRDIGRSHQPFCWAIRACEDVNKRPRVPPPFTARQINSLAGRLASGPQAD
jgi:hypothetical protein